MDMCVVDWQLVSEFVPLVTPVVAVFLALFVYRLWHIQKKKEVIASEAKLMVSDIFELKKLFSRFSEVQFSENENYVANLFLDLDLVILRLSTRIHFIEIALGSRDKVTDIVDLESHVNKFCHEFKYYSDRAKRKGVRVANLEIIDYFCSREDKPQEILNKLIKQSLDQSSKLALYDV